MHGHRQGQSCLHLSLFQSHHAKRVEIDTKNVACADGVVGADAELEIYHYGG